MQRELTITIDEQVYQALHTIVGRQNINTFIEDLLRSHVRAVENEAEARPKITDEGANEKPSSIIDKQQVNSALPDLEAGYRAMAADMEREAAALEWSEGTIGDAFDATR